jgi:Family of unknown function (DUF6644)
MPPTDSIHHFLDWLQNTPVAMTVAQNPWAFPTIESMHVLAITFVVGSIAIVDLRLLGLAGRDQKITRMTSEILPWTWGVFGIAVIAGSLMFSSNAVKYFDNVAFRMKFTLMLLAGVNMMAFQFITFRSVAKWDETAATPLAVKLAGAFSLLLWIGVVACGRWIGYTMFD